MAFFDIFKKKQDNSAAQASEERKQQQEELNAGLEKTKTGLFSKLARAVAGRSTVDADVLDDLEEVLISSDVGVETTVKIIRGIEERVARDKYMGTSELQSILREEVTALMEESHGSEKHFGLDAKEGEPYVVMVVGVNGAGKTTTIGKLAAQLTKAGQKVWIGAADTFRAAAIDQLKVWADRAGATMIRQEMGSDPASVAFDTLTSAKANGADVVLIDTAGRLHNKINLMNELTKIRNVMGKVIPGAPHEVMLVLDGSTGQNAFEQARQFTQATQVTSLTITKLDGTAKGGVVIGISDQFHIPVRYIGIGEASTSCSYSTAKSSSRRSSATAPAKADGPPAVPHNRRTAISERHLYIKSTNIALRTPRQSPELFCIYVSSGFFRRGSQLYAI